MATDGLQTFLKVTLPNLRPAITAGGLLVALYTLSDFGAVSLLRFNSFTRAIYVQYLSSFDRNVASLLSLALIVFTIILLLLERNSRGRGRPRYYRSSAGVAAPRKRIELAKSEVAGACILWRCCIGSPSPAYWCNSVLAATRSGIGRNACAGLGGNA